ncbi:DUF3054 domain-containing protein [Agromyces soli]
MTRPALGAVLGAFAVDAVLVVAFAAIGRRSHAEGLDVAGVWQTAWPFLAGLVLGWVLAFAWRRPARIWPTGTVIWVATLAGGMVLRAASGQGVQLAFVLVAAAVLALFLIGWRAIAALIARVRRGAATPTAS